MMAGRTGARISLLALAFAACLSIRIETDPRPPDTPLVPTRLAAHIEFDGNRDFLPQSLVAAPADDARAPIVRYHYQSTYYPPGEASTLESDVVAQGFLEIDRAGRSRTLVEQCKVTMRHTIWNFSHPTASELRAQALRCVRDRFDARIAAL